MSKPLLSFGEKLPGFAVPVRHRSSKGFADVRQRCEREPELPRNSA